MKFKLDENFGRRCHETLAAAGHDVATVAGQKMSGAMDRDLIEAVGRRAAAWSAST